MTFINISNHPSSLWEAQQMAEAERYGKVIDIPFPVIPSTAGEVYVSDLAEKFTRKIIEEYSPKEAVLHIMGEMCFTFTLVNRLMSEGYVCLASTSERSVIDDIPGYKEVFFHFVRFRKYQLFPL